MKEKIGPYKLIKQIAKGGMGEVYLAYDAACKREIALKCIRNEYLENKIIYQRFFKEAYLASHLTHPNIIPIYSLSKDGNLPYYTMPYIEGSNLKKILVEALEKEKNPQNIGTPTGSIPSLTHIFLTICQAVSYAHSQQIIHRDLKPENILIGKYGEVLIFDWGVADKIQNIAKEDPSYDIEELEFANLTSPGKIIGTLSFLAPERFKGAPANYQTDIYSLGVLLYIILTLKLPFKRKSLKEIKSKIDHEVLKNPIEVAPYRDIPHALVNITEKCLAPDPKNRYQTMAGLLADLTNFVKGGSEWIEKDRLHFSSQEHWGFHENILLSKHQAISQRVDAYEWISIMISKATYSIHTKIEMTLQCHKKNAGIGLLINAKKADERVHLFEGFNIWLSANPKYPTKLYRNNIEVLALPHIQLEPQTEYTVVFEQLNNRIQFILNGVRQFSYLSYLTLLGKHVGISYRDTHFKIGDIKVSVASPSLIVSCLDVPDSFFEHQHFDQALSEYRRIGSAFPGRHESREAFFRAGLTLLKKSELTKDSKERGDLANKALIEFESLKQTPGAPLEYLGKALVYSQSEDTQEELKCLELAILKYPKHPLLYLIYDHIIYRMYQNSHTHRLETHEFILLALRYNSYAQGKQMIDPLILSLADKKGVYFFLSSLSEKNDEQNQILQIVINLSFLLGKKYVLEEALSLCHHPILIRNILTALWLLKENRVVHKYLDQLDPLDQSLFELLDLKPSIQVFDTFLHYTSNTLSSFSQKILHILLDQALFYKKYEAVESFLKKAQGTLLNSESLCKLILEYSLLTNNLSQAKKYLEKSRSIKFKIHFDHHFLEGCYLYATEGLEKALAFFSEDVEVAIPHLGVLGCLFLSGNLDFESWSPTAFDFELMTLYRQLYLFYQAGKNCEQADLYYKKWSEYSYYFRPNKADHTE